MVAKHIQESEQVWTKSICKQTIGLQSQFPILSADYYNSVNFVTPNIKIKVFWVFIIIEVDAGSANQSYANWFV